MEERYDHIIGMLERYGEDIADLLRIEKSRQTELNGTYANAYKSIYEILLALQTEKQNELEKLITDKESETVRRVTDCEQRLISEKEDSLKRQREQLQSEKQQAVSDAVKQAQDDAQREREEALERANEKHERQREEAIDKIRQDHETKIKDLCQDYDHRLDEMKDMVEKLNGEKENLLISLGELSEYKHAFEKYIRLKKVLLECKSLEEKSKEWCPGDTIEELLIFVLQVGREYTFASTVCNTLSKYKRQNNYIPLQKDEIAVFRELNQFYRELYGKDKDPLYMPAGLEWNQADGKEFPINNNTMIPSDKNAECKYANGVCVPCLRLFSNEDAVQQQALVRVKR